MANANGLDPGLRSNYGTYVTFDPTGKTQSVPYGSPGTPGGVGWIAPEAMKSSGVYYAGNSVAPDESTFYNRLASGQVKEKLPNPQAAAFRGSNSSNFGDMSLPPDPSTVGGTNNTNTPGTPGVAPEAMRNLTNRKPTLGTSWGGWSNNIQTNSTPSNNNFTFYSRFA